MQQSTPPETDILTESTPDNRQRKQWDALRIESLPIRDTQNQPGLGSDASTSAS